MNHGYTEQIRDRITNAPEGSVFVNSDFADIADNNTINQSMNRLTQEGILRSVTRGVLDRPNTNQLPAEDESLEPDE